MEPGQTPLAPPLLITEALGFPPQLLLDDIINIANNAVQDGVNGMEGLLDKWADARAERMGGEWDSTQDVEQGLGAFQTLLEHHTDLAFDFFEAWSLRNIFAIPPDLPVVLPHHEALDLTQTSETEQGLLDDIERLRKELENHRHLKRATTRALAIAERERHRAIRRREHISFLEGPALDTLRALPEKFLSMYQSLSSLPTLDPAALATLEQLRASEPGKREWETSKTGYYNWVIFDRMLAEGRNSGPGSTDRGMGDVEQLRAALAMDAVNAELDKYIAETGV